MKKQGFSLIELMVVIVIMGVLAAIAVPKLFGLIDKAKASEVGPAAGTYIKLQETYIHGHHKAGTWQEIGYKSPAGNATGKANTSAFEYDANQGSAFYAKTNDAPMSFAALYNSEEAARPVFMTPIETTGVDYASINQYADFYKEQVAGKDGYFGGILPNDGTGINDIVTIDLEGWILNEYETYNGMWGAAQTASPSVGLDDPIFIDLTDVSVEEGKALKVKVWGTGHEFIIENNEESTLDMTVVNLLGQPVMSQQIASGSASRITHNLAEGIYVITLQNNKGRMSVKVIVR